MRLRVEFANFVEGLQDIGMARVVATPNDETGYRSYEAGLRRTLHILAWRWVDIPVV